MKSGRGIIVAVVSLASLLVVVNGSPDVCAASGSITVEPGQTKYISFGSLNDGDVMLWSLTIDTLSTVFTYWLEPPDGNHYVITNLYSGFWAHLAGEWKIGLSIDSTGFWNAYVDYTVYAFRPTVTITGPNDGSYVNGATVTVTGTADGYADEVAVSLDDVHYEQADLYLGQWNKQIVLPADGLHTIYAEATMTWGSYLVKYYDTVSITLDRELPTVSVTGPTVGADVRGGYVDVTWQCADNIGVVSTEMKIDGWDWQPVSGYEVEHVWLPSGHHVIQVRVTDNAGNQAIGSTSFNSDNRALSFGGPYYGLPIIAIVLAVIVVGAVLFLMLRNRKGGPTVTSVPKEEPASGTP